MTPTPDPIRIRLDKWLWAARFYKTRSLAVQEIERGRVRVNDALAKASREVQVGDSLVLRQGGLEREVIVRGLSAVRGPAPVAQALYEETAASIQRREAAAEQRRMGTEPALTLAQARQGRPTKRDRRDLADWNRWSASVDDTPDENPR